MELFELFMRNREKLSRLALQFCFNRDDIDDIMQNVSLKLMTTRSFFKGLSKPETWLYRIVKNECIDYYRKNARYRYRSNRMDIDSVILKDSAPGPGQRLHYKEFLEKIKKMTDGLNRTQRQIFRLYFLEQWSVPEIAEALKISANAVRCRVYQSRKKMVLMAACSPPLP